MSKAKTVEELRDAIDYALTYDEWIVVEEGDHRAARSRSP